MNKKLLSFLMCFVLAAALAFSAGALARVYPADAMPPLGFEEDDSYDAPGFDEPGTVVTVDEGNQSESLLKPVLICAVIGLVIALIVVLSVKSSYKPVRRKRDAAQYLVDGSLQITHSYETLTHKEVSERKIENTNASDS